MDPEDVVAQAQTISFEEFWAWIQIHANCILRVGAPGIIVHDHDDYHWQFAVAEEGFIVQVVRGKRVVAEMFIEPADVALVHCGEGEQDDYPFTLCGEESQVLYEFMLCHSYDEEQPAAGSRHLN